MKSPLFYIFIFFILSLLLSCGRENRQPLSKTELLMGTFVKITSYDTTLQKSLVEDAFDSAYSAMHVLENRLNPFDPSSEIAEINKESRHKSDFTISVEVANLLKKAQVISVKTSGAYDYTLWPVFKLWHFGTDSAAVPPQDSLAEKLKQVGFSKMAIKDSSIQFSQRGMGLDLSGISKGYGVEKARDILCGLGLQNFIIDAGGNLGIEWWQKRPVSVYIRHPRVEGAFFGKFEIDSSCGVATSGDYQNSFVEDSTLYHHILNPATGYPARRAVSVTVLAPNATLADGYSTALFVMGAKQALAFLEANAGLEGVVIFSENHELKYVVSSGLKDNFVKLDENLQPLERTGNE